MHWAIAFGHVIEHKHMTHLSSEHTQTYMYSVSSMENDCPLLIKTWFSTIQTTMLIPTMGLFYQQGLTLIQTWVSVHPPSAEREEIAHPFGIFNRFTDEVWEWIGDFTPHFIMDVITYPCWDQSWNVLVKGASSHHWAKFDILRDVMPKKSLTHSKIYSND